MFSPRPHLPLRKTKIIATVGPSIENPAAFRTLLLSGADLLRINTSHTTPAGLRRWIRFIRTESQKLKKSVPILVDLQGPRVRTGTLVNGRSVLLERNTDVTIRISSEPGTKQNITSSCRPFPKMVKSGDPVLLDNGLISLRVRAVRKNKVICRVISGGLLGENKGINLPEAPITLPALSEKDLTFLKISAQMGADYVALSFVRTASDIRSVHNAMHRLKCRLPVIAKIEKTKALSNMREIMQLADGVMVARGDLGIELGVEKVPVVQKQLIAEANQQGLPVIVATQMLETMIEHPRPTRAEASDVANAVFEGADAVMLSGETAVGKYPELVIKTMAGILLEAEFYIGRESEKTFSSEFQIHNSPIHAITGAAWVAANKLNAKATLIFTVSGRTAMLISKLRPRAPVFVFTLTDTVSRKLTLFYGVFSTTTRYSADIDEMLRAADRAVLKKGWLKAGDLVVVLSGKQALPGARYMTKVHRLGDRHRLSMGKI